MKKILLISNGYPSKDNLYSNAFIHRRVKSYFDTKLYEINVLVFTKSIEKQEEYEEVLVNYVSKNNFSSFLRSKKYDLYFVHFAKKSYTKLLLNEIKESKIIIWVHGYEALSWKRRLFILRFNIRTILFFTGYMLKNLYQMRFIKKLIKLSNDKGNINFVFVSNWMKTVTQYDSKVKCNIMNYSIIPNVIDEDIFNHTERKYDKKLDIISIRPYHSRKYANDYTIKVIQKLSKKEYFHNLSFQIYGKGRLFKYTKNKLKRFKNVKITETFFDQKELAIKYNSSDILLIPTRQDAQGVSMCEGMATGLVPITSNNTAIPEFVNNNSGYLCDNWLEMVDAIEELYFNRDILSNKSKEASRSILNKCSKKNVITKELLLFKEVLRND